MRALVISLLMLILTGPVPAQDLAAWNESPVKAAILDYLADITDTAHPDFIPVAERVAVLDNDGTFWCERPDYPSTLFQRHLLVGLINQGLHDGTQQPYKAWIEYDRDDLREFGWRQAYEVMNEAFAGMPVTAFRDSARVFLDNNPHSDFKVRCTELYYLPMLELARLLEAHDFQVWVVTGAEQDFVRSYIEQASGIPPERVIGSWTPAVSEIADGEVTVVRGALQVYNGYEAKPGNIETRIGRRPVFAAGNSNNDQPMCLYAVTGARRGLAIWIHHDDQEREYSYDRGTDRMDQLVKKKENAFEVKMSRDWNQVFKAGLSR